MIEETVTVPAHTRLDIWASGDWPHYVYQIRKKSAGQWFWRRAWHIAEGQVYRPGFSPAKTTEFYFGQPGGDGHAFFAESKPFKLLFRVEGRFKSYLVARCTSDEHGLSFTDPKGERVCGFGFRWNSSDRAYPTPVQFWV